ncbi:Coproporphyrinogen-III oxidase [uncultured Paludibacter sp.]|uniref:Coproporphyrinogen-III oxidase n=1 Tax=uncultured Paludibacter sp. TaxID=497635 RepID=A0A653A8J4_9BACT|nr:Coproporphyrinogen-III oxidase [uncultured Paludibacter sp.]
MEISDKLLEKYNVAVPRYTSYPPANYFKDNFSEKEYLTLLDKSNEDNPKNISIYIHIPFCNKICFYCGCNATPKGKGTLVEPYVKALKKEMEMVFEHLDKNRFVSQIHYGGGTPNVLPAETLKEINELIYSSFQLVNNPEIAIECNPAYLTYEYIDTFKAAGFNRFSIGIQDFDNEILKTVNREPSQLPVKDLINYLKKDRKDISVNLDFIYGLPGQTLQSFQKTIEKAVEIRPERLVTFSYAHVPWMMRHQQILEKKGLPTTTEKMDMFKAANRILTNAGYTRLGLDHFVLPDDELSIAYKNQQLHRNFQGYCTRRTTGQVYAFGVSGISQLEKGYIQNKKDVETYISDIEKDILPVQKGYILNDSEKITGKIIEELMCNEKINWKQLADELYLSVEKLKSEVNIDKKILDEFVSDELLIYNENKMEITQKGTFFIRNIVASLDKNLKIQTNTYSKSV